MKNCVQVNNINLVIKNSNVIILMTPWPEFKNIDKLFKGQNKRKIILIDPYRMFNFKSINCKNFKYFTIGK